MDRILIILKKENRSRASSALTLMLNTIVLKHVYWYTYMQQISGERLQDHWSSGCLCENKGADQLRGNREADQRLCFRYTDSIFPLLLISEISSF